MILRTVSQLREEFPVTQVCTYLDTAYQGPLPQRSLQAIKEFIEGESRRPFPLGRFNERMTIFERVRGKVAKLLGVSQEEVLFTRGTNDGLFLVASTLLKRGDEILVGGLDHPTNYAIWAHLATKGVKVTMVPHRFGAMVIEDMASAVGPSTKAVGMCLVNTYNGYRQDLRSLSRLCSENGLYLILDGIQAAGHLEIDLKSNNITALGAGVYKWFCSPEGLGIAYVNKKVMDGILPPIISGTYVNPKQGNWGDYIKRVFQQGEEHAGPQPIRPNSLDLPPSAKRLELRPPLICLIGLEAMVDILLDFGGMEAVEQRVLGLTAKLRASVHERGHDVLSHPSPRHSSGITSVAVPDSQRFAGYFQQRGIYVLPQMSPKPGRQAVRVSNHIFNNEEDIAEFAEALDYFVRRQPTQARKATSLRA